MRGHCWPLCATWDGAGYRSDAEQGGRYCPDAARTTRDLTDTRVRLETEALRQSIRLSYGDRPEEIYVD